MKVEYDINKYVQKIKYNIFLKKYYLIKVGKRLFKINICRI